MFAAHKGLTAYRQKELKEHKHLLNDLTPKYAFGCKRLILSEKYFAAMARSNICLHSSHIDNIVDQTIYTKDGTNEDIDVSIGDIRQQFFMRPVHSHYF